MPKYLDLEATVDIKSEELLKTNRESQEPPKGGIFIVSGGEVSFKEIGNETKAQGS